MNDNSTVDRKARKLAIEILTSYINNEITNQELMDKYESISTKDTTVPRIFFDLEPLFYDDWKTWRFNEQPDRWRDLIAKVFSRAVFLLESEHQYIPVPSPIAKISVGGIIQWIRKASKLHKYLLSGMGESKEERSLSTLEGLYKDWPNTK